VTRGTFIFILIRISLGRPSKHAARLSPVAAERLLSLLDTDNRYLPAAAFLAEQFAE
jgi:hypothetical protein